MTPKSPLWPLALASLAAFTPLSVQAVAVATPNGDHTVDPATGVPWDNVLKTTGTSGSAVYLGGGWVITANHVFNDAPSATSSAVDFMGVSYPSDPSQIYELTNPAGVGSANPDLRLYRLQVDLGLPTISLGDAPLGSDVTMIGFGSGAKTWGTNTVESELTSISPLIVARQRPFTTDYDSSHTRRGTSRLRETRAEGTFYEVTTGPLSQQGWYLGGVMFAAGAGLGGPALITAHADLDIYGDRNQQHHQRQTQKSP